MWDAENCKSAFTMRYSDPFSPEASTQATDKHSATSSKGKTRAESAFKTLTSLPAPQEPRRHPRALCGGRRDSQPTWDAAPRTLPPPSLQSAAAPGAQRAASPVQPGARRRRERGGKPYKSGTSPSTRLGNQPNRLLSPRPWQASGEA